MWVTFRCRCGQLVRTSRGAPSVACPGCDRTIRLPNHYRLIWVVVALVIVGLAGVSVLAAVLPRATVPSAHIDDQPPPGPPPAKPQPPKPDAPPPKADEPPPQPAAPQQPQQPADPPKPVQPPAPRPGPPVAGRLNNVAPAGRYEVGDTFTQDVTVTRISAFGIPGVLAFNQGTQYTLSSKLEVKAVRTDGSMTVEQTIVGGKLIDASADMRDTLAAALDKARGAAFTLTVGPTGVVIGLKGLDDPLRIERGHADLGQTLRLWSLLDADAWKEFAGHTFFQPDQPALGAKWKRDFTHDWGPLGSWLGRTDYVNAKKAEKDGRLKIDYGHVISHRPAKNGGDLGIGLGGVAFVPVKANGHVVYDPKTNRLATAEELFVVKGEVSAAGVAVGIEEQQHFRVIVSEVKPREMVGRSARQCCPALFTGPPPRVTRVGVTFPPEPARPAQPVTPSPRARYPPPGGRRRPRFRRRHRLCRVWFRRHMDAVSTTSESSPAEVNGMTLRRIAPAALLALVLITPATFADDRHETENFIVSAPSKQLAKQFGEYAERYRVEKAREWLGEEMPRWNKPCPLVVEINPRRTGGATTFTFSPRGGVQSQDMKIFGEVRQLLDSVLPHEVTHTVLAHHFGTPVPRWADEGGSVLSENDKERLEHDIKCREFLNASRGIPLRHLFPMKNYPSDTIVLYAQGFSVSNYLIDLGGAGLKGRQKFLQFLETGMARDGRNWEAAVSKHYQFASVDDLQEKWIESLRTPPVARGKAADDLRKAVATSDPGRRAATATADVRSTATLGIPQLEQPVVNAIRAAAPSHEADKQSPRASEWNRGTPAGRDPAATAVPRLLAPEIPSK